MQFYPQTSCVIANVYSRLYVYFRLPRLSRITAEQWYKPHCLAQLACWGKKYQTGCHLIGPFLVVILSLRMESHSPTTTFQPKWKRDFFSPMSWPTQNAIILANLPSQLAIYSKVGNNCRVLPIWPVYKAFQSMPIRITLYCKTLTMYVHFHFCFN